MKKITLIIAAASLLTASTSFAIDSDNNTLQDAQIFTKDFEISVKKESEIVIDPPERELVALDIEKLEDIVTSNDYISIGSMVVETTATSCYVSISTLNNFKLQGEQLTTEGAKNTLASYTLNYIAQNQTDDTPITDPNFSSNSDGEMPASCNTSDLKMNVLEYNSQAPVDAYNDIITVKIRAES